MVYVTTFLCTILVIVIFIFFIVVCKDVEDPEDDISSDIMVVDGYMIGTYTQPSSPSSIDLNGKKKTYPLDNTPIPV